MLPEPLAARVTVPVPLTPAPRAMPPLLLVAILMLAAFRRPCVVTVPALFRTKLLPVDAPRYTALLLVMLTLLVVLAVKFETLDTMLVMLPEPVDRFNVP